MNSDQDFENEKHIPNIGDTVSQTQAKMILAATFSNKYNPTEVNKEDDMFHSLIKTAIDCNMHFSTGLASQIQNLGIIDGCQKGDIDGIRDLCAIFSTISEFVINLNKIPKEEHNDYIQFLYKEEVDELVKELISDFYKKDINVSCRMKCSHCCHINLDVSEFEMNYILNKITLSEEQKEYIKKQADFINHYKKENKIMNDIYAILRKNKLSACPFLKDDLCSIYELRPIACRSYLSIDDPKDCDTFNGDKEIRSPIHNSIEIIKTGIYYYFDCNPISTVLEKLLT